MPRLSLAATLPSQPLFERAEWETRRLLERTATATLGASQLASLPAEGSVPHRQKAPNDFQLSSANPPEGGSLLPSIGGARPLQGSGNFF